MNNCFILKNNILKLADGRQKELPYNFELDIDNITDLEELKELIVVYSDMKKACAEVSMELIDKDQITYSQWAQIQAQKFQNALDVIEKGFVITFNEYFLDIGEWEKYLDVKEKCH